MVLRSKTTVIEGTEIEKYQLLFLYVLYSSELIAGVEAYLRYQFVIVIYTIVKN